MAEKKKKKNPRFGGKRDLKDISGNQKIGFEDTFLGDLLGFDGKLGTKGKPGLLASLKGARRKKPGTATTTNKKGPAKVRPKLRPKPDAKGPVRRGDGTEAGVKKTKFGPPGSARPAPKPSAPAKPTRQTENKKLFGLDPFKPRGAILRDVATPSAQKKNMKKITFEQWQSMSPAQRKTYGLPKSAADAKQNGIINPQFRNSKKRTSPGGGLSSYLDWATLSTGRDSPIKPNAKPGASGYNKGGMAKKSGYMYGGSVTKKKPMNKGGMAKKK
jgi:hypothetical protein